MAEPITIAKTAISAAKLLLQTDENGDTGAKKLIIGIAIGSFTIVLLFSAAVEIFLDPASVLLDFFSPDSITEINDILAQDFNNPIVSTKGNGMLHLPVANPAVSSLYGERTLYGKYNFHEGVDFPVAFDSPVMAVAPGTVVQCGVSKDYGDYIMLQHRMIRYDEDDEVVSEETFYSLYAHLHKRYVFLGQTVGQGQQIALSGGDPRRHFAGNSTGAHLHLELRRTQQYSSHFNPYGYLLDPKPFRGETKSVGWK